MFSYDEKPKRKPFKISVKKNEWMRANGKDPFGTFVKSSKCRKCKTPLTWGDRSYEFDHKDNNSANVTQNNCFLVCRNCHGKHTVIKKIKVKGAFGGTAGYKTIKRKIGYKKVKKKTPTTKRIAIKGILGETVGYKTVKIKKISTAKKKVKSKPKTKKKNQHQKLKSEASRK